jgi:hypothetical protein
VEAVELEKVIRWYPTRRVGKAFSLHGFESRDTHVADSTAL